MRKLSSQVSLITFAHAEKSIESFDPPLQLCDQDSFVNFFYPCVHACASSLHKYYKLSLRMRKIFSENVRVSHFLDQELFSIILYQYLYACVPPSKVLYISFVHAQNSFEKFSTSGSLMQSFSRIPCDRSFAHACISLRRVGIRIIICYFCACANPHYHNFIFFFIFVINFRSKICSSECNSLFP